MYLRNEEDGSIVPTQFIIWGDLRRLILDPTEPMTELTFHRLRINGVRDLTGLTLSKTSYDFTTGNATDETAPQVVSVDPADGATGVATNASVTFDEPLAAVSFDGDGITLLRDGVPVDGEVDLASDRLSLTFDPADDLLPATLYELQIGSITDLAGNLAPQPPNHPHHRPLMPAPNLRSFERMAEIQERTKPRLLRFKCFEEKLNFNSVSVI